jgi:hypothetical protein
MKVQFGSIWLAPGLIECASDFTVNGQQVNDAVEFYRAAAVAFFPRGLRFDQISFSVTRKFDTSKEAESFVLSHFGDLATQGSLYLYCGYDDDQTIVRYDGAVIDQPVRTFKGTSVIVQYTFRGGIPITDSPPPSYAEPNDAMIKRNLEAIPLGNDAYTVTFSAAFTSTPVIVANLQCPAGGDRIFADVIDGTVSATGFQVQLSGPTPSSGYKLSWIASA